MVWLVISAGDLFAWVAMKAFLPWVTRQAGVWLAWGVLHLSVAGLAAQPMGEIPHPRVNQALISTRDLKPIFNGTNLDGWISRGGKATYVVEDGVIVGTCAVKNGGNTFLCTEKEYGDFILELEVKADLGLNSGVQIRSHCFDAPTTYQHGTATNKIPAQRVHGYQVEVDDRRERSWSGGIYEEARRGWLFSPGINSPAGPAFKFGDWNQYRIECVGSSIKTWVNGVPAADLADAATLRGFIGLQVHSAAKPEYQVRFRNIRLQDLGAHRWQTAWDGGSLDALEQQGAAEWKVADGILRGGHSQTEAQSGTLLSRTTLTDFTIRLKYKLVKGEFRLFFRAVEGGNKAAGFGFQFAPQLGATNIAKQQDWNTALIMVQGKRAVLNVNGHQVQDTANDVFPPGVHAALELSGGKEAEVYFKDFEILEPVQ